MTETNHELFPGLPIGCSESLDGIHVYEKSDKHRIKYPGTNHTRSSYYRKYGKKRKEVFLGLCECGDVARCEVIT